jgi:hypothetical protein
MGVSTSQHLDDLLALLPSLDFVFCGDDHPHVRDRLIEEFLRTGNHRTTFLNPLATRFVMSLTKDARELLRFVPRARRSADHGFGQGWGPDHSA